MFSANPGSGITGERVPFFETYQWREPYFDGLENAEEVVNPQR